MNIIHGRIGYWTRARKSQRGIQMSLIMVDSKEVLPIKHHSHKC